MRDRNSKRLIIDADVARSSGDENATDPRAVNCRDFLKGVREYNHQIVITREINNEWKKHQSRFALGWRISMEARRRVVWIDSPQNTELQNKITQLTDSDNDTAAMVKDLHLLNAANATDKTIISCEQFVRKLYASASQQVREIRDIIWVNPDRTGEEQPIEWLKKGAPSESHRQLSEYPAE